MAGSSFRSVRIPSYTLHKATGQARVRFNGKDHYLGLYGSVESRRMYGEFIAALASGVDVDAAKLKAGARIEPRAFTVNELCLAFMRHAATYYVKNDQPTDEIDCLKSAVRPLVELYGHELVNEFGPLALKAVREKMVGKGWCRKYVNKSVCRVRHIFRWGVENELVEPATLQKLEAVSPLLAGRTEAPDRPPRKPVPQEQIDAVRAALCQLHRDLIDLQLLTGARSGELLKLTTEMLDRSESIWTAKIADHKTVHHGKERVLYFGPQAQLILSRYISADSMQRLFPVRRDTYSKAIAATLKKLKLPHWSPHWLRHTAASRYREEFGLESAQVLLGHSKADMTQLYAQRNHKAAIAVVAKVG